MKRPAVPPALAAILLSLLHCGMANQAGNAHGNGYDLKRTGLTPRYPAEYNCSPLTSLYASWDDVDGSKRKELHSGVDGGRLGEPVLAPGPGTVIAQWIANWGWGEERALLVRHTREDLGLEDGPKFYYSEFDHLNLKQAKSMQDGEAITRGEQIATVARPGGQSRFLPEVHWEVWAVEDDSATMWELNRFGAKYWQNRTAHLIDPLYMLARNKPPSEDGNVDIEPFDHENNYSEFRGFTYILPCRSKAGLN